MCLLKFYRLFFSQDYWRDSLYTGKAETEKHQFTVYYVCSLQNSFICMGIFLKTLPKAKPVSVHGEGGWYLGTALLQMLLPALPMDTAPELQLPRCQEPAGGHTASASAAVPFRVCWGRQVCHEMAKVIFFMISVIQTGVGCGLKGIWLSFTTLKCIWLLLIKLFVKLFTAMMWE